MTHPRPVADWLATRTPAPPRHLRERVDALCASRDARRAASDDATIAEQLLDVAEDAMRGLLPDGCLTRRSALELLAVDAIVTYAFEASADQPERLEELAGVALARIAALTEPYDA
jgi:hypothetical protein